MSHPRRTIPWLMAATLATGVGIAAAQPAAAAVGCRVDYTVTNQWQSGFGADVKVTNLGDAVTGWDLRFSFGAGQTVSQLWNGSVTQSGAAVSVRNAGWNGNIATNGTASFGFNGSWAGSNPAPSTFTLNGVACTGGVATPSSTPTTSPSATPYQTPRPTTTPTATPTPTPTPTSTTGPVTGT